MSDDHTAHGISAYGSRINRTPHLDRIAAAGSRMDAASARNSICSPSRAAILTGTYNHVNGVTTLDTHLDDRCGRSRSRCRTRAGRRRCSASGTSATVRITTRPGSTTGGCCPARATTTTRSSSTLDGRRRARRLRHRSDHRRLHRRGLGPPSPIDRSRCSATTRRRTGRGSPTRSTSRCTTTSRSRFPTRSATTWPAVPTSCGRCGCGCSTSIRSPT